MRKRVLIFGWYNHSNIGDDLFVDAFSHLFPDYDFVFVDNIMDKNKLIGIDAVFFGGGSFLSERPQLDSQVFQSLMFDKKIFYLGVGVESNIHPDHLQLMSQAKMIVTRSPEQVERLRLICGNVQAIPDLIYSLQDQVIQSPKIANSVLIMPNISVLPTRSSPYWQHAAWIYFKSEFCQFLDWLVENDYQPTFFPMCKAMKLDDDWAAAELVAHMDKRSANYLQYEKVAGISNITKFISKYEMVITQRFHGIVLSEITKTPYIAIFHHDKLKSAQPATGEFLSYYNGSKQSYIDSFSKAMKINFDHSVPIKSTIYESFAKEVASLI